MSNKRKVHGSWFMVHGRKQTSGQSLVEVLVVIAVAAIMIVSLIVVVLSGLKNAQFAQNQTKATKLAQDSIDKIRYIRDVDGVDKVYDLNPAGHTFSALWDLADFDCTSTPCYFKFNGTDRIDQVGPTSKDQDIGNGFSRQIILDNQVTTSGNESINLTVKIIWSDSSGTHESNLQTILTKK